MNRSVTAVSYNWCVFNSDKKPSNCLPTLFSLVTSTGMYGNYRSATSSLALGVVSIFYFRHSGEREIETYFGYS